MNWRNENRVARQPTTLTFTPEQTAALPRNSKILVAMWEAEGRGDMVEAGRLLSALDIPAHTLMAIKNTPDGAEYIRKKKLRTRLAEEKYGPDWMDLTREEGFARHQAGQSVKKAGGR